MNIGDRYLSAWESVANSGTKNLLPPNLKAGQVFKITDIYVEDGNIDYNLKMTDGTVTDYIEKALTESITGYQYEISTTNYLIVENVNGDSKYIAYRGVVIR